jgi:hypothetical protein
MAENSRAGSSQKPRPDLPYTHESKVGKGMQASCKIPWLWQEASGHHLRAWTERSRRLPQLAQNKGWASQAAEKLGVQGFFEGCEL